jgi:aspartate/methionine/tyrosine aminotransferase
MFSDRIPDALSPNRLALALADTRAAGRRIIDLTESNPTRASLDYPTDLLAPLGASAGLAYTPHPLGLRTAREAIAGDYARRNTAVSPDRIALTASTSEAYALLFKVLCNPGDEVLVPRPSYPLFEHLTRFEGVVAKPYDLDYHGVWTVDRGSVERAVSDRTRAILVVHPNNPTGSFVSPGDLESIAAACRTRGAALIADEVFCDYELESGARARAGDVFALHDVLVFALGGLSKSVGLPQVKLAWIAVGGADRLATPALDALELACDTYLSVSTPVQLAAAHLFERGASIRRQIHERIARNYAQLGRLTAGSPASALLRAEGGWSAVVRMPAFGAEEDLVLGLLAEDGVLVHPGYFFDFPHEAFVIVSLLPEPQIFDAGVARLLTRAVVSDASSFEAPPPRID